MSENDYPKIARVKLANDFCTRLPLWGYDDDDDGPYFPEGLVSESLEKRLVLWADTFDVHYDDQLGWPSKELFEQHRSIGETLYSALKDELEPEVTVEYYFWETAVQGQ